MERKMVLAEGFTLSIVSGVFGIWGGVSGAGLRRIEIYGAKILWAAIERSKSYVVRQLVRQLVYTL